MKPTIEGTSFGNITIDGSNYSYDVLIRLDWTVTRRAKKLSKQVYGTSHKISLAEAEYIYQDGADMLVIGSGQFGLVDLSAEAKQFFDGKSLLVDLKPTPEALQTWNQAEGNLIGMFHVSC